MCGIAGMYKSGTVTAEDIAAVLRMLDAQEHRGPDDWGLLLPEQAFSQPGVRELLTSRSPDHIRSYPCNTNTQLILGSRRLSIIDLSPGARMPMVSSDQKVFVSYNGEIYNYRQIRDELKSKGYDFVTDSDTEVILNGYKCWGADVIHRLRGMFGFAVADLRQPVPKLLLARDRFGMKQVYYSQDDKRLLFASEFRAILKSRLVQDESNPQALIAFLQLGSIPVPHTTNKNVQALPAGSLLETTRDKTQLRMYWDLKDHFPLHDSGSKDSNESFESQCKHIRSLLEQTVQQHLISDVPLGVFLSGGIDSSSLVALAAKQRSQPLTTVSVVFDEPEFNEQQHARTVAKLYKTDHREIILRKQEFHDGIPEIFSAMDQPTVDGVNTYVVSKAAKESGLKVVLSGVGGDEVFIGYGFFHRLQRLSQIRGGMNLLPGVLRKPLAAQFVRMAGLVGRTGAQKLGYLTEPTNGNLYLLLRGLFVPSEIQQLLGLDVSSFNSLNPAHEQLESRDGESLMNATSLFDFKNYLENQLLRDVDAMSMAHSIETRAPFLDHVLAEQVLQIPVGVRLGRSMPKPFLVNAMGKDLPESVWNRKKMGFTLPFEKWMREDVDELERQCHAPQLLDAKAVSRTWNGFRNHQCHWSRPWALLVLSHWLSRTDLNEAPRELSFAGGQRGD